MKGEHKPHKEVGHWPYLAIVVVVAVVAIIFLVLNARSSATDVLVVDEEGNIVGDAQRNLLPTVRYQSATSNIVSSAKAKQQVAALHAAGMPTQGANFVQDVCFAYCMVFGTQDSGGVQIGNCLGKIGEQYQICEDDCKYHCQKFD